jgi:hypothetical protein
LILKGSGMTDSCDPLQNEDRESLRILGSEVVSSLVVQSLSW